MKEKRYTKNDENWLKRFHALQGNQAAESEQDAFILDLAKTLQEPNIPPLLWEKIENKLNEEKRPKVEKAWWSPVYLRAAAMVIFIIGTGFLWQHYRTPDGAGKKLLNQSALQKVISTEKAYEAAIAALEKQASPKLQKMDLELMFLYRDKLATIDEQIDECRQALRENPGNAHIRRYMLAALQDKKETLKEIISEAI